MTKVTIEQIKKLKESTGAPVMQVKKILEKVGGNEKKAEEILRKEGFEKVEKRKDRITSQGAVFSYVHHSGKVAALVELLCETDFVARNELFTSLGRDIAMQIASMEPKDSEELLGQDFIKDPAKKISDLVKELIAKTGENVRIGKFFRVELGKN